MFINGKKWDGKSPLVMGVLNLSPDSFYIGSTVRDMQSLINRVSKMVEEGLDILDIGGSSSKPNAEEVSEEEEWRRIEDVVVLIKKEFPGLCLSIDTFRASVAEKSLALGADMINDISAGHLDSRMFEVISKHQCHYTMMHMKGNPQNMHTYQSYEDIGTEVSDYFKERIEKLNVVGFKGTLIVDPGFGFSKNSDQNYELLNRMQELRSLGLPILAGLSRKSMIYKNLGITADEALNGTTALNMFALTQHANILRVHDVKEAKECIKLYSLCRKNTEE